MSAGVEDDKFALPVIVDEPAHFVLNSGDWDGESTQSFAQGGEFEA